MRAGEKVAERGTMFAKCSRFFSARCCLRRVISEARVVETQRSFQAVPGAFSHAGKGDERCCVRFGDNERKE